MYVIKVQNNNEMGVENIQDIWENRIFMSLWMKDFLPDVHMNLSNSFKESSDKYSEYTQLTSQCIMENSSFYTSSIADNSRKVD